MAKFPLDMQVSYLDVCISMLPCVMDRIISDEDYAVHRQIMEQKKKNITGIYVNSRLDDACNDRMIMDYSLQFLKELKGRMVGELQHSD